MASKYTERHSTSLIIKGNADQNCKEKPLHTVCKPIIKNKTESNKCWLECAEIGALVHCGKVKWDSHCGEQYVVPQKMKQRVNA